MKPGSDKTSRLAGIDMPGSYDAIVIGAGLAGLSAAFEFADDGHRVLVVEAADQVGGRTSNWKADGMDVESGIHKFVGIYKEFPRLLRRAGLRLKDVFIYQDEVEIRVAEGGDRNVDAQRRRRSGRFGLSVFHRPMRTVGGALGNRELISWRDKWQLMRVFSAGLARYLRDPESLDQFSIAQFARDHGASNNVINTVIYSLSGGLFFLPPERYSAYAFFSLSWASMKRSHRSRLAVFAGGMTDVMAGPLADAIKDRGGELLLGTQVARIVIDGDHATGVEAGGAVYQAPRVVLAAQVAGAKKIIRATFDDGFANDPELQKLMSLSEMPSVAVQLELDEPGLPDDHIIFGPNSILGKFGEQSHTTFRSSRGRISAFLSPSEPFLSMPDADVVAEVVSDLQRQGVNVAGRVRQSAVVRHPSEFYLLEPGSESRRPRQRTKIRGLALAGDYTKQPLICSMEGAVMSCRLAVEALQ
jgi:15-cis-phytoene desaturase